MLTSGVLVHQQVQGEQVGEGAAQGLAEGPTPSLEVQAGWYIYIYIYIVNNMVSGL